MGVYELYKPFRNKMAELSYEDTLYVTWAYSQYLQIDEFEIPPDIQVSDEFRRLDLRQKWIAEWELEILAKEVLINGRSAPKKGRSFRSWDTLVGAINQLKNLENAIYGSSSRNARAELLRIAHRQFVWQGNPPNSTTVTRYFKIFEDPIINQIAHDRLGLSVRDIYLCGVALMGTYLSHPAVNTPFPTEIKVLPVEKFTKFLSFSCRPIADLRAQLRSQQKYDERFAYAYNSLREFPLIQMPFRGRAAIVCPLPTLLYWRITGGLYYELLSDRRFSQAFGMSFQKYVGQVIDRACPGEKIRLFGEQKYGTKKARKDAVDWIVSENDAAIFLECKAKRLTWSAKEELDDLDALDTDINALASAVEQVYKTISDYKRGQYPHFPFTEDRKIYPVIATLEDWHLLGSVTFERLHDAVLSKLRAASISEEVVDEMPYTLMPIEDLEVGMQIINTVGVRKFFDGKLKDAEMKWWHWRSYVRQHFRGSLPVNELFSDEYKAIFADIVDQTN